MFYGGHIHSSPGQMGPANCYRDTWDERETKQKLPGDSWEGWMLLFVKVLIMQTPCMARQQRSYTTEPRDPVHGSVSPGKNPTDLEVSVS